MKNAHIPAIAAAVPCDYIFAIDYHTHGFAALVVKGIRGEAEAWRRLTADYDLRGARSITLEAQPI